MMKLRSYTLAILLAGASLPSLTLAATPMTVTGPNGTQAVVGANGLAVSPGPLGQTTKSASLPVTIASDQGALGSATVTSGNITVNGSLTSAGNVTAIVGALPAGSAVIGALVANQTVQVTNTPAVTVSSGNITVGGSLTSGGNVTVTSGNVGGYSFQLSPTITVQNAAYSIGYSEAGLITVTGATRTNGGSGTLTGFRLRSAGGATNTIWVYAWSKLPSATCTDKATFVGNTADGPYAIPGFPQQITLGGAPGTWDTTTYANQTGVNAVFKNQDTSPGTAIYMCFVTAAAVTPGATSDLTLILTGYQD